MAAALSIVHVLRAPVGGLFRHVRDLARAQGAAGHGVGVIADAGTGGEAAEAALSELQRHCALGVHRLIMSRLPGPGDMAALRRIAATVAAIKPDVLHGHGAKGGLYARLAARKAGAKAFYTPHGGVLHYQWSSPAGALYLMTERMLLGRSDGLVFVCAFERRAFQDKIGLSGRPSKVVYNGLWPEDFAQARPAPEASDVLFVGELRYLKGVDVLIAAINEASALKGRAITATIVGDGPDRQAFEQAARQAGLASSVRFTGAMPARTAFTLGRVLVIPSRAESFPYIVLEAIAAGLPIIASRVGGIVEALDPGCLVAPGDAAALAAAIAGLIDDPAAAERAAAQRREEARSRFDAEEMGAEITAFYRDCGA